MYNYVLFDLDGTISDSSEGITKGIRIALKKMGIEVEDLSELRRFIGPPLKYSFSTFYGFDDEQCKQATIYYREYYSEIGLFENELYPGMAELLERIKKSGRKIAVATSKPERFTLRILEKFGIRDYFNVVAGASPDDRRDEKYKVVEYALAQLGNPPLSEVVLVGDTRFDAEGAGKIGIDCIGVLYGFGTKEDLLKAGAKYIAPTIDDIYDHL